MVMGVGCAAPQLLYLTKAIRQILIMLFFMCQHIHTPCEYDVLCDDMRFSFGIRKFNRGKFMEVGKYSDSSDEYR